MPKQKSVWLKKQVNLLKKLYPTHTQKYIAKTLGVSLRAVKCQVTVLKIKKRKRGWTITEEKYLLKHYKTSSKADLAKRFGKCRGAVIRKYNQLTGNK